MYLNSIGETRFELPIVHIRRTYQLECLYNIQSYKNQTMMGYFPFANIIILSIGLFFK